jgi:eukaryotic-like serine/threonine-protein kinase
MANPTVKVSDYCSTLSRSRLMTPTDVSSLRSRWQTETQGTDEDVDLFRKYLISHRYLTEYQAAMVQRGHSDGFYIGGYVILDRIGRGQMAGVYKAVHESGQLVALKVLSTSRAKSQQILSRFQREGRLLTQLNHPNIVRAFQIASTNDTRSGATIHFIVMDHLEGETLDEALSRRKNLPPGESVRIVSQALAGLQHLHDRRMIHRDLKPANLMLVSGSSSSKTDSTLDATVKILDIGLGRELFTEDGNEVNDQMLTVEGAIIGTPDYTAPEQSRDSRAADIRSDIYSLGCVLYHSLAGRPPFVEKTVMATVVKHATESPPPIQQFNANVPPGLQAVLNTLLAKDPSVRFQTPIQALNALKPFLPPNAVGALSTKVLPGFQEYLDSEHGDMPAPKELNGQPKPTPAPASSARVTPDVAPPAPLPRSGGISGPPSGKIRVGALASGLSPAAQAPPSGGQPPQTVNRPKPSVSGPPSGKIRVGTGLAAALAGAGVANGVSSGGTVAQGPPSFKPPSIPGRPSPLAAPSTNVIDGDFDVELLAVPSQFSEPADVLRARMEQSQMMRPLYDLDRRDFIMLSLGAGGVLSAIGLGLIIAKVQGEKSRRGPEQQSPEIQ